MTDFGFKKAKRATDNHGAEQADFSDLRGRSVSLPSNVEEAAVARGHQLGFADRGNTDTPGPNRRRRRIVPQASPKETIYIRAPEDLAQWFQSYVEQKGYRALWQGLEDFRNIIEGRDRA